MDAAAAADDAACCCPRITACRCCCSSNSRASSLLRSAAAFRSARKNKRNDCATKPPNRTCHAWNNLHHLPRLQFSAGTAAAAAARLGRTGTGGWIHEHFESCCRSCCQLLRREGSPLKSHSLRTEHQCRAPAIIESAAAALCFCCRWLLRRAVTHGVTCSL
jgi:hypothetical protein